MTAIRSAVRKYFAAIFSRHTRAEAMLVDPPSLRWLVRPFHCLYLLTLSQVIILHAARHEADFVMLSAANQIFRSKTIHQI